MNDSFKLADIDRLRSKFISLGKDANDGFESAVSATKFYSEKQYTLLLTVSWAVISGITAFKPTVLLCITAISFSISLTCIFWAFHYLSRLYERKKNFYHSLKDISSENTELANSFMNSYVAIDEFIKNVSNNINDWKSKNPYIDNTSNKYKRNATYLFKCSIFLWTLGMIIIVIHLLSIIFF